MDPPFEKSEVVKPIQINTMYKNLTGEDLLISGWGSSKNENVSTQLQSASIEVTRYQKDLVLGDFRFSVGKIIEMSGSDGVGACFGDSGGNFIQYQKSLGF